MNVSVRINIIVISVATLKTHLNIFVKLFLQFDNFFFQEGDKLPSVTLFEATPNDKVDASELFAGKKGVLFAVPGAFTPGCSKVRMIILKG